MDRNFTTITPSEMFELDKNNRITVNGYNIHVLMAVLTGSIHATTLVTGVKVLYCRSRNKLDNELYRLMEEHNFKMIKV